MILLRSVTRSRDLEIGAKTEQSGGEEERFQFSTHLRVRSVVPECVGRVCHMWDFVAHRQQENVGACTLAAIWSTRLT